MHLLVLSAFRHEGTSTCGNTRGLNAPSGAQCFPTRSGDGGRCRRSGLNAPSGAQCFPTSSSSRASVRLRWCLNAPSGAQCFPTMRTHLSPFSSKTGLNAPSGAQCFPTPILGDRHAGWILVSMHLLVLSAFRQRRQGRLGSSCRQVSMHLLVLSAFRPVLGMMIEVEGIESQCTFWCSVLSDRGRGRGR